MCISLTVCTVCVIHLFAAHVRHEQYILYCRLIENGVFFTCFNKTYKPPVSSRIIKTHTQQLVLYQFVVYCYFNLNLYSALNSVRLMSTVLSLIFTISNVDKVTQRQQALGTCYYLRPKSAGQRSSEPRGPEI